MIEGAIFDLDGTLIDSMQRWRTLASDYLISVGAVPKDDLAMHLRLMPLEESFAFLKEDYRLSQSVSEIGDGCLRLLIDFYRESAALKEGVFDFLTQLKKNDVTMCVATASDRDGASLALERLGVLSMFDCIVTCADVGLGKESPLVYREALRRIGAEKERTLVFEDTYGAAKVAHGDGFHIAGVYDAAEARVSLMKEISDIYIEDFSDEKCLDEFWKTARMM